MLKKLPENRDTRPPYDRYSFPGIAQWGNGVDLSSKSSAALRQ
jgi:hypothetical protein